MIVTFSIGVLVGFSAGLAAKKHREQEVSRKLERENTTFLDDLNKIIESLNLKSHREVAEEAIKTYASYIKVRTFLGKVKSVSFDEFHDTHFRKVEQIFLESGYAPEVAERATNTVFLTTPDIDGREVRSFSRTLDGTVREEWLTKRAISFYTEESLSSSLGLVVESLLGEKEDVRDTIEMIRSSYTKLIEIPVEEAEKDLANARAKWARNHLEPATVYAGSLKDKDTHLLIELLTEVLKGIDSSIEEIEKARKLLFEKGRERALEAIRIQLDAIKI